MPFGIPVHVPLRMACNSVGALLTFHLAPQPVPKFNLYNILVYDQVPVKLIPIGLSCTLCFVLISYLFHLAF